MKAKNTKKALLCSALSLLLCFAMLIGSTFAWFTDKVEVTGNRIVAGNLDVEMDYYDVKAGAWVDVEEIPAGSPSFFRDVNGEDILWEPGAVAYATFKVANEGTLALKYTLKTIAENFNTVAGTNKSLKDVLTVCVPTTVDTTSREALIAATNGAEKFDDFGFTGEVLTEGASKEFTVVIYWAPSAVDNEYNLKDGKNSSDGKTLWIDLDFSLVAIQATVENDSFDNLYDVDATYLAQDEDGAFLIQSTDDLRYFALQAKNGNTYSGQTIKLTADVDLTGYNWVPITNFKGTLDGDGHTISGLTVKAKSHAAFFGNANSKLTVKNIIFKNPVIEGHHYTAVVLAREGAESVVSVIDNVVVDGAKVTCTVEYTGTKYDNGDKVGGIAGYSTALSITNCTVKNSEIKGYRDVGGLIGYANSKNTTVTNNTVDNCVISCDYEHNYENYTRADEYDIEAFAGQISGATVKDNTAIHTNVIAPQDIVSVGTAADLMAMLESLTSSGAGDNVINITSDINIGSTQWVPAHVDGYTVAGVITINGNGHTITGLNAPLIAGGFAGNSGIIIKDLILDNANINDTTNDQGVGAFIGCIDSMPTIKLSGCKLTNSTITSTAGARVGGLIGWTAGYNGAGSVMTNITVENCEVSGCNITANGSVGAIIGHDGNNEYTHTIITKCTIKNNVLHSTDDGGWRVGAVVGTVNEGDTEINDIDASGNTITQVGKTAPTGNYTRELYGRTVFNGKGSLTIDGVAIL